LTGLDTRAIDAKELSNETFPNVHQGFRIYISEDAFDRATERGGADLSREVGGVLVGKICKDESGPFLKVDATIDALYAEEKRTELTFTQDTWDYIHQELESKHKGKNIVGWYHTHPGFGIFLSDRDTFIHQSFFNLPYQVALVYDPKSHEHGVFVWRDNEPARCRQYWIGREETLWDGARASAEPKASDMTASSENEIMSRQRVDTAPPEREWDWMTMVITALAILLIGGLAGFTFAQYRLRDVIQEAQIRLDRDRAAAAEVLLRGLNVELLSFVREAAGGGESLRRDFDEGLAAVDLGLAQLSSSRPGPEAMASLLEGRRKLEQIRDTHFRADRSMKLLQSLGERSSAVPREVAQMVSDQRAALGQLYAEVAGDVAKDGDTQRARRLLQLAATLDPGNARRYEDLRASLQDGGAP
jgi:proteasome lid subunit RPN8/RPN11